VTEATNWGKASYAAGIDPNFYLCITSGAKQEPAIRDNWRKRSFLATPRKFAFADTLGWVLKTLLSRLPSGEVKVRHAGERQHPGSFSVQLPEPPGFRLPPE